MFIGKSDPVLEQRAAARPGAVCFVAGGEGTAGGPLRIGERCAAVALAARGWRVHFLWCGPAAGFGAMRRVLEAAGVSVSRLDEIPLPGACRAPNGTPGCGPALYTSNLIRYAVESLHRLHCFDAVVFPAWQAAGFRCVQAKRSGTAFADVNLVVRIDCIGQWQREADKRWHDPDDLFLDYCERYTFENADIFWTASAYMRGEAPPRVGAGRRRVPGCGRRGEAGSGRDRVRGRIGIGRRPRPVSRRRGTAGPPHSHRFPEPGRRGPRLPLHRRPHEGPPSYHPLRLRPPTVAGLSCGGEPARRRLRSLRNDPAVGARLHHQRPAVLRRTAALAARSGRRRRRAGAWVLRRGRRGRRSAFG